MSTPLERATEGVRDFFNDERPVHPDDRELALAVLSAALVRDELINALALVAWNQRIESVGFAPDLPVLRHLAEPYADAVIAHLVGGPEPERPPAP